ncbi:MAG: PAS domain S-box protein [Ignavibacteriota bacterium]
MDTLNNLPVVIFIVDDKVKIIYLKDAAADFTGEIKQKCLSKKILDFIEDKNSLLLILETSNEQYFPKSIEIRFNRLNGKSFYTILSVNIYESDTQQEHFIISSVDLTNQKMQIEIVKDNQIKFENIANSALDQHSFLHFQKPSNRKFYIILCGSTS